MARHDRATDDGLALDILKEWRGLVLRGVLDGLLERERPHGHVRNLGSFPTEEVLDGEDLDAWVGLSASRFEFPGVGGFLERRLAWFLKGHEEPYGGLVSLHNAF